MPTVGKGKYTYELIENWAALPPGEAFGNVSAVATDSQDRVYVFQRKDPPVMVFDRNGTYLHCWGIGAFANPHGIYIADGVVYLTDREDSVCLTYTLDGKPLQILGHRGVHSDTGCDKHGELVPHAAGPFNYPTETTPCTSAKAAWTGCRPGSASWTGRATWSPGGTRCRPTGAGWTAAATSTWRWDRESAWTSTCVRTEPRPHSAVGQHALSEEPDRVHDVPVRRPAGVGVAQAEQEGVGARGLLPALEFPHARLGVAEDQAIGREIVQRERRVGGHAAGLRQPGLPVVAIRRHDVPAVPPVGLAPRPGHPRGARLPA